MFELVAASRAMDRVLKSVAEITGWLFIATIIVICFDVVTRKFGYQLPYFTSTRLQELEWHLASGLFLGWIGYGLIRNIHVRIDVFTGHLPQSTKDRIDLIGVIVFALPYCLLALPYAWDFFMLSYSQLEMSDAPNGLPARYVIKFFLFLGFALILLSAISMFLRKIVDVWGPPELHSSMLAKQETEL